jgi:hypothetical protein
MELEQTKKRLNIIRAVHYGVLFLFFVSLYLILNTESLGLYGATAILFMGGLQYAHRGHCPLTLEEQKLREKLGDKSDDKFIEGILRKHFGLNVHRFFINGVLGLGFIVSGYELGKFLLDAFTK